MRVLNHCIANNYLTVTTVNLLSGLLFKEIIKITQSYVMNEVKQLCNNLILVDYSHSAQC